MVRILNFCCFAFAAFACLALYHVSEQTRVAKVELSSVDRQIADEHSSMKVLEADWQRVADPARIQELAHRKLGLGDAPTMELSSLELLPRRGEALPAGDNPLTQASAVAVPQPSDPRLHLAALHTCN
jgi:cell division protein FtsL